MTISFRLFCHAGLIRTSISLWFVLGVCLSPSLVNLSNVNMHDIGSIKFSLIFN
jgi:hypothetical protein